MRKNKVMRLVTMLVATLIMATVFTGCKPYEKPVYVEGQSFQTLFNVPLEGNLGDQVKFNSAEQLEQLKVAARRIQIPLRWKQTGRWWWMGEYIPMVQVIKVDRTPVTVEWEPILDSGKKSGDGIWVESSDSIGFSTGFRITAQVEEEDTAQYLYSYRGNDLKTVLENEVKSKVQENFANFTAKYKLDDLRGKKNEMYDVTKQNVIPFFKERGITITTLAMFGGFTYENPQIQDAIDKTFIAQQEKVVSAAQLAAQDDKNSRIELEAKATAEAIRIEAQGKADAIEMEKKAEAAGITLVTEAAEAAQKNPLVLKLRELEIEKLRNERWDGKYPTHYMVLGSSDGNDDVIPDIMLQVPMSPVDESK